MRRKTVLIVPATVPDALVTRLPRREPEGPTVISAEPAPVPTASPQRVVPEQLTVEQIRQLRAENEALRQEIGPSACSSCASARCTEATPHLRIAVPPHA